MMNIILTMPTPHDIYSPLKKQYRDITVTTLTTTGTIHLAVKEIQELTKEIVESANRLPNDVHYHLLLTGQPLANQIAYEALKQKHGIVGVLSFSSRNKRYLAVPNLSEMVKKEGERIGGIESEEKKNVENPYNMGGKEKTMEVITE